MPYKFNDARRHKIVRQKFKVTNWAAYNESLRCRGDLTVWVSDEALCLWSAARRTSRGGQPKYSDMAITLCLTLRVAYRLPLRQPQGLTQWRGADGAWYCRAGLFHPVASQQRTGITFNQTSGHQQ